MPFQTIVTLVFAGGGGAWGGRQESGISCRTHITLKRQEETRKFSSKTVRKKYPELPWNKGSLLATTCVARDLFFSSFPKRVKSRRHIQALTVLWAYCVFRTSTEHGVKCVTIKKGLNGRGWVGDGKAGEKVQKHHFPTCKNSELLSTQKYTCVCLWAHADLFR